MAQEFKPTKAWWKEAIIYQIYPISFFDSNGDGIGDLNGIYSKLDYLKDLGVDVLWLSPIYRSPLADMGYDISDYREIDPRYGTLQDWDNLLKGIHDRGMKLMMDLVINHTSDEHDWFVKSRSSKSDPKRDWYIWRPPKYDATGIRRNPNNWKSIFQGPAWELDETTDEYYLHLFVTKQPDLNWENPEVRQAAWDVMRFWIDRGCDGFRMDVINMISKVDGLPDAPITLPQEMFQPASSYFANGPKVHQYIKEMYNSVLSKKDLITVGETPLTHSQSLIAEYVLPQNKELNMVFQFEFMDLDSLKHGEGGGLVEPIRYSPWKLEELRGIVTRWQTYKREEGFWNAIFIENHDHARSTSRFGNDAEQHRATSAKMLALLQITQTGTLFVYQGQELGMKNFPRGWGVEEYKDVASVNYWERIMEQRKIAGGMEDVDMSDVLDDFQKKARDHARVPMQWNASPHAGFTTGTPWMRVNEDYEEWNAERQIGDDSSVRAFWKRALAVRKEFEVLIYGNFVDISNDHPAVFAYIRTLDSSKALVFLSFTAEDVEFELPEGLITAGEVFTHMLGNRSISKGKGLGGTIIDDTVRSVMLGGYEGNLYIKK